MLDIPNPPQLSDLRRPPIPSACGHDLNHRRAMVKAVKPAGDVTSNTHTFMLRSLSGGPQQLTCVQCPQCRSHSSYLYRAESGGLPVAIDNDPEAVRTVLHAVLDQPAVAVFTLVVTGEQSPTSYVLPRHHLPAFRIVSL